MWLRSIKENKNNCLYWGYLTVLGIIFYIMNVYTPLYCDDWHYQFKFGTTIPIQNISDIFVSQYTHYFHMNGRFIPHYIVQFFDGITGKEIFNIANTVVFLLFIHLFPKVVTNRMGNNIQLSLINLFIIAIFSTMFGEWYLWMSGACNYLWPATFLVLFHYILFNNKANNIMLYPILFTWGIICGWTQESIVIGAGFGYFIYFITQKKEITTARLFQLLGFYVGILLLVLAPANINRAIRSGTLNSSDIISYIWTFISLKELSILYILLLIISIKILKRDFKSFVRNNIYIIGALIISILFILFIKIGSSRAHFGIFFFSIILVFKYISSIKNINYLFYLSIIIISIGTLPLLSTAIKNHDEYQNLISQLEKKNDGIIMTNEVKTHPLIKKYIIKLYISEYTEFYQGFDPHAWENQYIAKAFNKSSISFIPKSFIEELNNQPEKYNEFIIPTQYPFYAKRVNKDMISKVTYLLNKPNTKDIPFYLKPISHRLDRYNLKQLEASLWSTIKINNNIYLLVGKNTAIDNRLKEFIYE